MIALLLGAPLIAAQPLSDLSLTADPSSQAAEPGQNLTFTLVIRNDGVISEDVTLGVDANSLPADWTYSVATPMVTVESGTDKRVDMVIQVPSGATTGVMHTLVATATPSTGERATTDLEVSVVAPAASSAPAPSGPAPNPPLLDLSVSSGDSAGAGEDATGTLTIHNGDTRELRVSFAITGNTSWQPRLRTGDSFRVLAPDATVTIPLLATVPAELAEDSVATFSVAASAEATSATTSATFTRSWSVSGTAAAPASPSGDGTTSPGPDGGDTTAPGDGTTGPSGPAFLIVLRPDTLEIEPGATATTTARITNTGSGDLRLTLAGSAADGWPITFEPPIVEVPEGQVTEAIVTIKAPEAVPIGGLGAGRISATSDVGLSRGVDFRLSIVPPSTPVDQSEPATPEDPANQGEAQPTPSLTGATVGLVVGLGAVGAAAIALANRPLREKLMWGAVGLYTRLSKPDVMNHEERERLYGLIQSAPGTHFHGLQRKLDWNTGTLTYHLRVLERHGFIVSRRDGIYRRFYLQGAAPRQDTMQGPTGLRADVLEAVQNQHGISQADLTLALGANKQTINYHVKALERAGTIRIERRGRETFLFPAHGAGVGPAGDTGRARA